MSILVLGDVKNIQSRYVETSRPPNATTSWYIDM